MRQPELAIVRPRPVPPLEPAMHDLAVVETTLSAYRFLARELASVARLSWAAFLVVALAQYAISRMVLAQMASALDTGDVVAAAAVAHHPAWLALKFAANVVGTGIVAVALHELILFGDRKSGQYVLFACGRREALFMLLAFALSAVVLPFMTFAVSPFGEPTSGLAAFGATLALIVALYLAVRLWPMFPIIVLTGRLALARAWDLTRNRFWSLLGIMLLGSIPIGIMALVIDSSWPSFDTLMDAITGPRQSEPSAAEAAAAVARAEDWLIMRVVLDFLASIVSTAVTVALISHAYLRLTGGRLEPLLEAESN
jgi:hypothetical protein